MLYMAKNMVYLNSVTINSVTQLFVTELRYCNGVESEHIIFTFVMSL